LKWRRPRAAEPYKRLIKARLGTRGVSLNIAGVICTVGAAVLEEVLL
jgi:hypothetical protein